MFWSLGKKSNYFFNLPRIFPGDYDSGTKVKSLEDSAPTKMRHSSWTPTLALISVQVFRSSAFPKKEKNGF